MVKSCLSLIVFGASVCCAHINFLGVPGYHGAVLSYGGLPLGIYGGQPITYAGETVSSSIYPFRTALDVLNVPPFGRGITSLLPQQIIEPVPVEAESEENEISTEEDSADNTKVAPADVVDVGVEEEDDAPAAGIVPIKQTVDSLPLPPLSLFRDPTPPIPAGIAQATQPIYVDAPFKNFKVSPLVPVPGNSKDSPVLQQIKQQSSGILILS